LHSYIFNIFINKNKKGNNVDLNYTKIDIANKKNLTIYYSAAAAAAAAAATIIKYVFNYII
jgi:hypothetical protein